VIAPYGFAFYSLIWTAQQDTAEQAVLVAEEVITIQVGLAAGVVVLEATLWVALEVLVEAVAVAGVLLGVEAGQVV
jgi:hypothetical protein